MLNYKELAENILSDVMNNGSISDILLKTKIFASKRGDKELLDWVSKELGGYDVKPPKYRILPSGLKVEVFVPFRGTARLDFPAEMIKDKDVRNRLSNMGFNNPISEIENLCQSSNDDSATVQTKVHVYAYQFMAPYINGDIQDAFQYVTKASVSQIIVAVKSLLIDFFLKVSNEEDIDFNTFVKNNPSMSGNITINAGVVNTGSGTVNAQGSTNVVGDNNTITPESKQELLRILTEIDKIAVPLNSCDYNEVSQEIKNELEKDAPAKNLLKRCFQAIPSIITGIGTGVVANGLSPLISSALSLL